MRKPLRPQIALSLALAACLSACRAEPPPGDAPAAEAIRLEISVASGADRAKSSDPDKATAAQANAGGTRSKQASPHAAKPTAAAANAEGDSPGEAALAHRTAAADSPRPRGSELGAGAEDETAAPRPEQADQAPGDQALVPVSFSTAAHPPVATKQQPAGQIIPALVDEDDALLPQTEQLPGTQSAFYKQLGETLFKAIVDNNPELLIPYFMPVQVYAVLKESKNPPRDWKFRLYAQLKRDIQRYHRALGKDRARAHFLGLEVNPDDAIWMKPGREYNKLSYYRLFGSRIRYSDPRGRERSFELSALFSWRGEWYIVHLNGLK